MYEKNTLKALTALDLIVHRARYVILDPSWGFEGAMDSYSRIYYVKEGRGILTVGDTVTEMSGGNMYFIPSELRFSTSCDYLEKIFFHISIPTAESYDLFFGASSVATLPFLAEDFDRLKKLIESESYLDMLKVKSVLINSVLKFAEHYEQIGRAHV